MNVWATPSASGEWKELGTAARPTFHPEIQFFFFFCNLMNLFIWFDFFFFWLRCAVHQNCWSLSWTHIPGYHSTRAVPKCYLVKKKKKEKRKIIQILYIFIFFEELKLSLWNKKIIILCVSDISLCSKGVFEIKNNSKDSCGFDFSRPSK
jgi:hypothetical protein